MPSGNHFLIVCQQAAKHQARQKLAQETVMIAEGFIGPRQEQLPAKKERPEHSFEAEISLVLCLHMPHLCRSGFLFCLCLGSLLQPLLCLPDPVPPAQIIKNSPLELFNPGKQVAKLKKEKSRANNGMVGASQQPRICFKLLRKPSFSFSRAEPCPSYKWNLSTAC